MSPKFVLDIDKETYEAASSKFINVGFDLNNKVEAAKHLGEVFYRKIECQAIDWDTQGKSMKIDTIVIEDNDKNHEEKISFGVDKTGIWKGKALFKNITGKDMEFQKGRDGAEHPFIDSDDISSKEAVGMWTIQKGENQTTHETTYYPKLQDILPKGYTPAKKGDLGL